MQALRSAVPNEDYIVPEDTAARSSQPYAGLRNAPPQGPTAGQRVRRDAAPPLSTIPHGLDVEETPGSITITRAWRSPVTYGLMAFAALWDAFMIVWIVIAVTTGAWGMLAAGSLHILVGVGVSYAVAASLVNRTVVRADRTGFSIWHGPLPTPGRAFYPREDIEQVYIKRFEGNQERRGPQVTATGFFIPHVLLKNGRSVPLKGLSSVRDTDVARYYEEAIERALGIADRPVQGEYAPY